MLVDALPARLKVLEDEIVRLPKLAAEAVDQSLQDNYWRLAQDVQREARQLRSEIWKETQKQPETTSRSAATQAASRVLLCDYQS